MNLCHHMLCIDLTLSSVHGGCKGQQYSGSSVTKNHELNIHDSKFRKKIGKFKKYRAQLVIIHQFLYI